MGNNQCKTCGAKLSRKQGPTRYAGRVPQTTWIWWCEACEDNERRRREEEERERQERQREEERRQRERDARQREARREREERERQGEERRARAELEREERERQGIIDAVGHQSLPVDELAQLLQNMPIADGHHHVEEEESDDDDDIMGTDGRPTYIIDQHPRPTMQSMQNPGRDPRFPVDGLAQLPQNMPTVDLATTEASATAEYAQDSSNADLRQPTRMYPVVPLQPWEADKLQSIAEQVLTAMEEERYDKDYGAILLNNFGWQGAEEWAQNESARLRSLVDADDVQSRREFRHWIEDYLLCFLREVQNEVNRGMVAGMLDATGSASSSGQPLVTTEGDLEIGMDDEEERLLNQALLASMQEM